MSKKRKKKKRNVITPFSKHKKVGSKRIAPIKQLPTKEFNWARDLLPEYLWINSLSDRGKSESSIIFNEFLDMLDNYLDDDTCLSGIISDFSKISNEKKELVLHENYNLVCSHFLNPIGRLLSLFPQTPANWLVSEKWLNSVEVDKHYELEKLENSLLKLYPGNDEHCGFIRTLPMKRLLIHNIDGLPPELKQILTDYPFNRSDKDKALIESISRMRVNIYVDHDTDISKNSFNWSQHFWRRNYELSGCRFTQNNEALVSSEVDKTLKFNEVCKMAQQDVERISLYLDAVMSELKIDIYEPSKDEVILGLFSRISRLCTVLLGNPELWAADMAGILLRCLVDSCICLSYLLIMNDDKLYDDFIQYGKGKEKLLLLNLQDNYPEGGTLHGEQIESLTSELGSGIMPEMVDIDFGKWSGKNIRQMAEKSGLLKEYSLIFDPLSGDIHGNWVSLKRINLTYCRNPLHRFHRLPQKLEPQLYLEPLIISGQLYNKIKELCEIKHSFPEMKDPLKINNLFSKDASPDISLSES